MIATAIKLLQDWKHIKKELNSKRNKRTHTYGSNNYGKIFVAQSSHSTVIINECAASSNTITPKKRVEVHQEDNASSSENESWESLAKQKKETKVRKFLFMWLQ